MEPSTSNKHHPPQLALTVATLSLHCRRSLEDRAREHEVAADLKEFLESQLFKTSGFAYSREAQAITIPAR